jgi:hypothetical protein
MKSRTLNLKHFSNLQKGVVHMSLKMVDHFKQLLYLVIIIPVS